MGVTLIESARSGNRRSLARLVSRVEDDTDEGRAALAALYPTGGAAWVTGVTGAPGAGKSTLVDGLVGLAADQGNVAVVAVDPSSPFSGGAVLGDRIRMQRHTDDPRIYIRSMANRGHLGGLADSTPRVVALLDGIGFSEVLIETVGVGQAEIDVASSADTVIVAVNPGWGDSIQAAKAGLLEIGDVFVVNKGDRPDADETVTELLRMLDVGPDRAWRPPIVTTIATDGTGLDDLWAAIIEHRRHLTETGDLQARRTERASREIEAAVRSGLRRKASLDSGGGELLSRVAAREIDPWSAAGAIIDAM
ncbi:MAG: methylmalonyl Co-A mutase-associated GTPase MeaB [Actinomycetota bacterium]|nr:methylmalonyl Co-A mutase-associated GTPase MeaB [Actinomycetota bacterium]